MENSEEEKKRPPEGEKTTKRKMKTAGQLELLEKTYLRENYPSEFLRAELSEKLGLTDRQLQMWFCHRRLKDRKIALKKAMKEGVDNKDSPGRDDWSGLPEQRKGGGVGGTGAAVPRIVCEGPSPPHPPPPPPPSALVKRYCDPPLGVPAPPPILWHHHHHHQQSSMAELHAISVVEAQLGEPLREDGPLLGIEFDPLPPDAFGRPIVPSAGNPKHGGWQYDSKTYERQDGKSIKSSLATPGMEPGYISSSSGSKRKASVNSVHMLLPQPGTRALHEYQFLPEQPSARSETYDRTGQSDFYDSPIDSFGTRSSSLPTGGPFSHSSEHLGSGYPFQSHASNVNLLQHGRHGHLFSPSSVDPDGVTVKNSLVNYGADAPLGSHAVLRLENTFISPEKQLYSEEDASRMERKRKSEEARIAKEVEAHEKRIRKELERQDIIRRKKEEQMRRDLEKQDRERRKEEERMLREKQREEERFQREQRRELERREKFLQKENLRAEKMRHKEELRREKEAARIKAANERATARKIARESLELIEDERLELMELAASSKGLPSIVSLDSETLQHLELFRDKLISFPPKSVQLKAPFGFQPWIDSEENIGNLLMAWRFLITFVDVLELWPFTLDEFVQSFHDYDPRLLGEIHIALLKSIIKDIEDVARTPSVGLGASQNSAANPGGGHPQIVEGAYAWGFDIRSWQRHLNPLTWPEVLRQLALSAGFGPRWKKSIPQRPCFRDDNEGHDGMDVVSTLRSGAAAESAAAMMQEKGFSYLRRSRHRLTPGTVKYAAFYVLSLEGSRGLTILEVAEKIQKSGLRDLTTSKTPEASIAAALSRDANLFERTAPSTYCVRPAFRKDPADAEAILQAARERIQMFQNGLSDSEEAEKDTEDNDVEREEDFECEAPEDPEIDEPVNLGTSGDVGKNNSSPLESTKDGDLAGDNYQSNENSLMENNTDNEDIEIDESSIGEPWVQGLVEGEYSDLSVEERLHALVALIGVTLEGNSIRVVLEERLEAANALKRQMWAEAQLDKRRMKEEIMSKFQVSPFTIVKAEGTPNGAGLEEGQSPLVGVDNKSNDLPALSQTKQEQILEQEGATNYLNNTLIERNLSMQDLPVGPEISPLQQSAFAAEKSRSQLKAYIGQRAEELYVYRSLPLGQDRRRNRYWQFVTFSGNDPGRGRIFFESTDGRWRLIDSEETFDALLSALDVRGLREAHLHSMLQKIEKSFREATKKSVSGLAMTDLNSVASNADASEAAFFYGNNVEISSPSSIVCGDSPEALEYSKSFKIDLGSSNVEKIDALRRYHEFQKWIWMECFHSSSLCATKYGKKRCFDLFSTCDVCYDLHLSKDKHCRYCHETFESSHRTDTSFNQHIDDCEEKRKVDPRWKYCASNSSVPMRVRVLKALLALIEVSLASEALKSFWSEVYRKSWGIRLHGSTSSEELLQVLMMLEAAVKRDFLSQSFETAKELLGSAGHSYAPDGSFVPGSLTVLPWIPRTTAAVALRLLEFDASISYTMHQRLGAQRDKETEEFVRVPSRFTIAKSTHDFDPMDVADETEYRQDDRLVDSIHGRMYMRGRGGRGRGRGRGRSGRGGRGNGGTRSEVSKVSIGHSLKLVQGRGRKGRSRGRGRGRGSRTLRGKQLSRKARDKKGVMVHRFNGEGSVGRAASSSKESSRRSARAVWDVEEASAHAIEENGNSVLELSESDDNEQASGDEFDEPDSNYNGPYSGRDEGGMLQDSEVEDEDPEDDDVCGNVGASDDDEDDDDNDVDDDDDDDGGGGGDAEDVDDEDVDGDAGDGDDGDDGDDDDDDDRSGSSPVYYSE
ncbi:homeobox-DDT domain protein RLT2-like isoform X2 [Nymphaea colorata]|uniref:homeobox-DDT domain protein RLT2-like isoform X2 n=1 Tax=Nymphaea colorata TaxID=210225 RepID=UPI00129DB2AC|nr:homeobox-DDT domain protein RLT2-like isoform X2 [Nymphaea colorata]